MAKKMVLSRAPLRITFVGGGTDIPEYYRRYGPGVSIAASINKYVYISIHKNFEQTIKLSYSKIEIADSVDDIKHPSIREALRMLDIRKGVEIHTDADVPANGTGLGASSSFAVALLKTLHEWKGEEVSQKDLAEESIKIEREILKEQGGRQDQYMAALGGFQFLQFNKDGSVDNTAINMDSKSLDELKSHLLLLYTGIEKPNAGIHGKMGESVDENAGVYRKMVDLGYKMLDDLSNNIWQNTGRYLHENWLLKKITHGLDNPIIDDYYKIGLDAGAEGGKVMGAGSRGFIMFFAAPECHEKIIKALPGLRYEPFDFSSEGAKIIYSEE
jgi:D-glycero-alpha-D-manno-heptose-7-phosphate kinase